MLTGPALHAYTRRGHQLLARCAAESGNPSPSAADFAGWLARLRPGLRTASWRAYRAAACHVLEGHPDPDAPAAIAALRALGAPAGLRPPRRTSARRAKKVTPPDLVALLEAVARSRSQHGPALRDWLVAGILTGLRPCEWSAAVLSERVLRVRNAKAADGWRGLGESRELDLSALAPDDLDVVRQMVERASRWAAEGEFGERKQACSDLLRAANNRLWPERLRRPTLYSCRHQFAANGKQGDTALLAAAMGHAAERSAFRSYGRAADGWGGKAPPMPGMAADVVARVRRTVRSPRPQNVPSASA